MNRPTRHMTARKGDVLFRPGQECPGFLLLDKGSIKVTLTAASGREVVLYRVQPGGICLQTFTCLIERRAYAAEGVAESDLEGEMIPAADFRRRLEQDAGFRDAVLDAIAHRFAEYEQLIEDVALTGFDARLARALLRLADREGEVAATHDALAKETASGRAFVTRRLAELARSGLIEQKRGGVRILDRAALEKISFEER